MVLGISITTFTLVCLAVFIWLGRAGVRGFHPPAGQLDRVFASQAAKGVGQPG